MLGRFLEERNFVPSGSSIASWPTVEPPTRPRQTNGSDCGVFVCMYARSRCELGPDKFHFKASEINQIRRDMRSFLIDLL